VLQPTPKLKRPFGLRSGCQKWESQRDLPRLVQAEAYPFTEKLQEVEEPWTIRTDEYSIHTSEL
jgi:hypothetical protein